MNTGLIILILSSIGIVCGILIFLVNRFLPKEAETLRRAEEIAEQLPGMNCGACGFPGCFAYAQELAKDKDVFFTNTCATVLQSPEMLKKLEKVLGNTEIVKRYEAEIIQLERNLKDHPEEIKPIVN